MQRLRPELLCHAAELARQLRGGSLDEWISYFDWKYLRNPYVAEPIFHLALSGDRAIGMRGLYGTCWEAGAGGRRHVFPAAGDSTILSEHRDEHLYRTLGEAMLDDARARGYTHVINMSASRQTALTAMITYGWKGVVSRDVMTTQALPSTESGVRRHFGRLPGPIRMLARRGQSLVTRNSRRQVFAGLDRSNSRTRSRPDLTCRLTSSMVELADVAERAGGDQRLRLVRDSEFFRWRLSNPRATYRALVCDGGEDCGYMILSKKPNLLPVFVLDWHATNEQYRDALVSHAVARLAAVNTWSATLSSDELATLRAHGFVRLDASDPIERRRKALLVRPLADPGNDAHWVLDGARLDVASTWHVHAIGSDYY